MSSALEQASQESELETSEAEVTAPEASQPVRAVETERPRPRVALMGEFSAGKSTLSNLLLGKSALPVNVTATQLPPVWISYGTEAPYRVGLDGTESEVDPSFADVTVRDTSHVRIFHNSKFLKSCDLIDMPGISDPNMAAEVWQRVIHNADIVIWCSHATQAWRQSEAAVWGTMPPELYNRSLLLLTRMDRILSERDRSRVIKRVERETKGLFREVLPVSLIKALDAGDSADAWAESGADALIRALIGLVDEVASGGGGQKRAHIMGQDRQSGVDSSIGDEVLEQPARIVMPTRIRPRPLSRSSSSN